MQVLQEPGGLMHYFRNRLCPAECYGPNAEKPHRRNPKANRAEMRFWNWCRTDEQRHWPLHRWLPSPLGHRFIHVKKRLLILPQRRCRTGCCSACRSAVGGWNVGPLDFPGSAFGRQKEKGLRILVSPRFNFLFVVGDAGFEPATPAV